MQWPNGQLNRHGRDELYVDRRIKRFSDSDDPCFNQYDYLYGHRNDERMYWNSSSYRFSKSKSDSRRELTDNMLRPNCQLNRHRGNELYVDRRIKWFSDSDDSCLNKHHDVYRNGNGQRMHSNSRSDSNRDCLTECTSQFSGHL